MNKKMLLVLLVGAMFIIGSSSAFAFGQQHKPGPVPMQDPGKSPQKRFEKMASELGLSDSQKQKFMEREKQLQAEAQSLRAKNKELFGMIQKEMLKDSPDKGSIHNYMEQISKNRLQIEIKRIDQMIALRKEFTPEQKEKLKKIMENHGKKGKRFKKGGNQP